MSIDRIEVRAFLEDFLEAESHKAKSKRNKFGINLAKALLKIIRDE